MASYFIGTRYHLLLQPEKTVVCDFGKSQDVVDQLDVRIMLRVPHDVLKKRRHERHGYHTAGKKFP